MAASDEEAICVFMLLDQTMAEEENILQSRKMRKTKKRRVWVHDWLSERSWQSFGHYAALMIQLREKDAPAFKNFTRMDPAFFDQMWQRLTPKVNQARNQLQESHLPRPQASCNPQTYSNRGQVFNLGLWFESSQVYYLPLHSWSLLCSAEWSCIPMHEKKWWK